MVLEGTRGCLGSLEHGEAELEVRVSGKLEIPER